MWGLTRATRVFVRAGATDLRLGFDGLYGLVETQLKHDPLSGHVFVFCNRARTRVKLLSWDGSGLWLCTKRLEHSRFAWPQAADQELEPAALQALLAGLETLGQRAWFRK